MQMICKSNYVNNKKNCTVMSTIQAEIWNINVVLREYGKGQIMRDRILTGYQLMEQHSAPITDAAFSPDGTALATAARDGFVKFFQVNNIFYGSERRKIKSGD